MADEKIEVQLGANVAQLEEGVEQGAEAVDAGTQRMIQLLEQLVAASTASTEQIVANEQKIAAAVEHSAEESESAFSRMTDSMKEQAHEAGETLEGFVTRINGIQKAFALLAEVAMAGFVGEKIFDLAKEFSEFGDNTQKAAQRTGLSTAAIQELGFAAKMFDVDAQQMNTSLARISRTMVEAQQGSKQAEEAFKSVGLSVEQLKEMPLDQVLGKVADAFAGSEDGATKSAIAMQLFGRAGAELIPMLNAGSSGIEELRKKAQELGLVMGGDDLEAAAKLDDQLKEMGAQMEAVKLRAGGELAPAISQIAAALAEASTKGGVLDEMFAALAGTLKTLTSLGLATAVIFEDLAEVVVTAGVAAEQAATGQFSTAAATIEIGLQNIQHNAQNAQAALDKMWASAAEGNAVDMGEKGGGADGWGEKNQLKLGKTDKGSGPSQVELWKQQLQQQEEASGNFFKSNLADEDTFWASKLATLKAGTKEYVEVYHELFAVRKQEAQEGLADSVGAIKAEYEAAKEGSVDRINLANQIAQKVGQAYGFESREYNQALIEERKAAQQWAAEQTKILDDRIVQQEKSALSEVALREQAEKTKLKLGEETATEEVANLQALESQRYAIVLQGFDAQLKLYADDEQQYRKTLAAKLEATQQHAMAVAKLEEQASDAAQQKWMKMMNPVTAAFSQSVNGMIQGTTTWQSAMGRMIDSVLAKFVESAVEGAERWIAQELAKTAATEAGAAIRATAVASGAGAGLAAEAAAGQTSATNSAYRAAAAVYADVAEIPYVGWIMAPPAAAAAFVAVEAFSSGIASAAGGYYQVPDDMFANIHKNEMVLPAWAAQGVRNMISAPAQGAASGGGGGVNVNLTSTFSGNSDAGFTSLIRQHRDVVYDAVKKATRNGRR